MNLRHNYFIFIIIMFFLMIGCSSKNYKYTTTASFDEADLVAINKNATDDLLTNCNIILNKDQPIIVTSLVNIDNIQKSSTYGRISSEIIASRLAQQGFYVKEVKMSQVDIFVRKNEGEFALSRQLKQIADKHDVQAVVVGTYATGPSKAIISLRLISTLDNRIGCAKCYTIQHNYQNKKFWLNKAKSDN